LYFFFYLVHWVSLMVWRFGFRLYHIRSRNTNRLFLLDENNWLSQLDFSRGIFYIFFVFF
jgi:hypothetical protein